MEWNDPKINWYLTKPFFYHSSNNNPILSEMDQRFLHRKKKILLDHKDTFRNDIILRVTIRYYPRAKLKSSNHTIRHNSFTRKKRHKDYFFKVTKLFLVETTWILPLETELKPDTRQILFHQRIRLTKTRYTLLPFLIPTSYLYTSASSCFYRLVATDSPDTGEQRKAKWRASAGSTRYRFHHVSPGHATLSAPFTDHHDAIFPPNPPPTCTRIYRANRKRSTWIHGFDSCPLSSA